MVEEEKRRRGIPSTPPGRVPAADQLTWNVERNLQYASHDTDRVDLIFPELDVSPLGALQ